MYRIRLYNSEGKFLISSTIVVEIFERVVVAFEVVITISGYISKL